MIEPACVLMPLTSIRPTEETIAARVREVIAMLLRDRVWTQPICVEGTLTALLDGHHRLAAAQELGLSRIPVHVFDYAKVERDSWRPDVSPTRAEVLRRAESGDLYPYKTTRHTFPYMPVRPVSLTALMAALASQDAPATVA